MRLQIIDDNDKMRSLIRSLVQDLADTIYECSDGCRDLAVYEVHHPDWVLMDIKMEKMDGISAMKEIKAEYPEAKIVIVTGYEDLELRSKARDAGACAFVLKENLFEIRQILMGVRWE